ncbi:acyl transferase/acyl hydrolase/lysophospholipase, partial [Protomyces lactucae-debilis]
VLALLSQVVILLADVFHHYKRKLFRTIRPRAYLKQALDRAPNFAQYEDVAERLDYEVGNDVWRRNPISRKYDHRVITSRITKLRRARSENDLPALLYMLRSGLLRNLANIGEKKLYNRSYLGTKLLIQEYTSEVMQCLEYVRQQQTSEILTTEKKLQFFRDTRQSYGQSALILQGGVTFGMFHLGVVKALWEQEILPSVLCGTGVGALVAAIVCMTPDYQLPKLLYEDYIDFSAYETRVDGSGSFLRRIKRFWHEGYLLDTEVLAQLCRDNLGELTFEEAFQRTNRVLNITVSSTAKSRTPALLNYLTTPHVLIWTAALASNSLPGLFEPVSLLGKDETGRVVPWQPFNETKFHIHATTGTPYNRISELFNVNNFITSQARPYLAPFLSSPLHRHARRGLYLKIISVLALELSHRTKQLANAGLIPLSVLWANPSIHDAVDTQQSELTLVPELTAGDFSRLLMSPTNDALRYWRTKGERATWPAMACLRVRCLIEMTLKEGFEALR